MSRYESFLFPDVPLHVNEYLAQNTDRRVVIGIIGKSTFPQCDKLAGSQIYDHYESHGECKKGRIKIVFEKTHPMIFLHFETTYDNHYMEKALHDATNKKKMNQFLPFNSFVRTQFARMLLFAMQICHIIVLVDNTPTFDASYLQLFKALKSIREKYILRFLPKLLKNSASGGFLGKNARLCSPRILFFFEKGLKEFDYDDEALSKCEFEIEDNIYKVLRNEFIITNNTSMSLFSIPSNKRFVFINQNTALRYDSLLNSMELLIGFIDKSNVNNDIEDNSRPYDGFGTAKGIKSSVDLRDKRKFSAFLNEHVQEAIQSGFDDSVSKFKGKSHFHIPKTRVWYDAFKLLHNIFIENPDNPDFQANDPDYKVYLENFNTMMDIDEEFFLKCCDFGLKQAILLYNNPMISHYSSRFHKSLVDDAINLYMKYARGPNTDINEQKLKKACEHKWKAGKQQCEYLSLRGNPCIKPKHAIVDATEHSSGVLFISACNCGRTQGHREDPYTVRQANYEFYESLANSCPSCTKLTKVNFPVFEPSINDYRAAKIETKPSKLEFNRSEDLISIENNNSIVTTISQPSHIDLSLKSPDNLKCMNCGSTDESLNELILKLDEESEDQEKRIFRQPSTIEYLPNMVHTESPVGLLPLFSSWSLVCLGPSSAYSHNTGLLEHFQSGFISGANYLLPWDVHVRLDNSVPWLISNSKIKGIKKGHVFTLKIFVGCEYECPRGHRFIMSSAETVLRGGVGIVRDSGSKVVYNDMPLYFPCPCRTYQMMVAQLMRVHIVTPKAPVNVLLDPKVKIGSRKYTFSTGLSAPAKLSQSAYWILRLPYIYQGEEGALQPPADVSTLTAKIHGCLLSGMYGVSECGI